MLAVPGDFSVGQVNFRDMGEAPTCSALSLYLYLPFLCTERHAKPIKLEFVLSEKFLRVYFEAC